MSRGTKKDGDLEEESLTSSLLTSESGSRFMTVETTEGRMPLLDAVQRNLPAAVTVAIVSLSLSIALGIASGAGPQAGLSTAVWGGIAGGLFASSPYNIIGPAGALAPLLSSYSLQVTSPNTNPNPNPDPNPNLGPNPEHTPTHCSGGRRSCRGSARAARCSCSAPTPPGCSGTCSSCPPPSSRGSLSRCRARNPNPKPNPTKGTKSHKAQALAAALHPSTNPTPDPYPSPPTLTPEQVALSIGLGQIPAGFGLAAPHHAHFLPNLVESLGRVSHAGLARTPV